MKHTRTRLLILAIVLVLATIGLFALLIIDHGEAKLPYRDRFAQHRVDEWLPLGGFWQIQRDDIANWSDAPGSKLITGSKKWTDYQIWSDVELLAHDGDAGLVMRASDVEIGVDSYLGYYAGIRSEDGALVIGRADHSWLEKRPVPVRGGVQIRTWYRLHVVAVGCSIAAEVTNFTTGLRTASVLHEKPESCIHRGQFGLRSTDASGAWRNVIASAAGPADLTAVVQASSDTGEPSFPEREDANSRMRINDFPEMFPFARSATLEKAMTNKGDTETPISTISVLRALPQTASLQRLRGIITFVSPTYLQDDTGGIEIQVADKRSLSIGDQIEATGTSVQRDEKLVFAAEGVQLLRDRTPIFPLSVTPAEAMAGYHEGVLIDVAGEVTSSKRGEDGTTKLVLAGDGQTFDALLQSDIFAPLTRSWSLGSTVRVRGVCVMNRGGKSFPRFAVLVAQPSDITELAGPSWRKGWRLSLLVVTGIALIATGFVIFLRFERAKNNAIIQERARLSHDMHDTLAQSFAGVGYHLQGLRKSVEEDGLLPPPLLEDLNVACRMVRETHREASASIAALHPQSQSDGDLLKQLEHPITSMFDKRRTSIEVQRIGRIRPLRPAVSDVLFRVGMEALANVSRHSGATQVRLSLRYTAKNVVLEIADNGVGFATDANQAGFGIETMQRRCDDVKATLEFESSPGAGCVVRITGRIMTGRSLVQRFMRENL